MTYNQVQSFQVNDYANHNVDIEITGCRELYSINCKQPCLNVYNMCIMCVRACVLLIYQEFMLAITQLSHFSDLRSYYNHANILQAITWKADV